MEALPAPIALLLLSTSYHGKAITPVNHPNQPPNPTLAPCSRIFVRTDRLGPPVCSTRSTRSTRCSTCVLLELESQSRYFVFTSFSKKYLLKYVDLKITYHLCAPCLLQSPRNPLKSKICLHKTFILSDWACCGISSKTILLSRKANNG